MTHRANQSPTGRLGGFAGRVFLVAVAAALCVAGIALTVSMCGSPSPGPQQVVVPTGSLPTVSAPSSAAPSTPAAPPSTASATPSIVMPAPATTPAPSPMTTEPTTTRTVTPPRTVPRTTVRQAPRPTCTPQEQWVFRPSTGTYEKITLPC